MCLSQLSSPALVPTAEAQQATVETEHGKAGAGAAAATAAAAASGMAVQESGGKRELGGAGAGAGGGNEDRGDERDRGGEERERERDGQPSCEVIGDAGESAYLLVKLVRKRKRKGNAGIRERDWEREGLIGASGDGATGAERNRREPAATAEGDVAVRSSGGKGGTHGGDGWKAKGEGTGDVEARVAGSVGSDGVKGDAAAGSGNTSAAPGAAVLASGGGADDKHNHRSEAPEWALYGRAEAIIEEVYRFTCE